VKSEECRIDDLFQVHERFFTIVQNDISWWFLSFWTSFWARKNPNREKGAWSVENV